MTMTEEKAERLSQPVGPWRKIPDWMSNCILLPKIEEILLGVSHITQDNKGVVTLHYTDENTESAPCPEFEIVGHSISSFKIVDTVQTKARA